MTAIDTKSANLRPLRFNTPADAGAEVQRLVQAEREGRLNTTGNWSLGTALNHLAAWIEYGYTGPPIPTPPFALRVLVRLMKKRFIHGRLTPGVRIPNVEGGTLETAPAALDAGLARFAAAWRRLESEPPQKPNIILGQLTHEEWIQLNLRHAELHLGFFHIS